MKTLTRQSLLFLLAATGLFAAEPPLEKKANIQIAIEPNAQLLPMEVAKLETAIEGGKLETRVRLTPARGIRELVVPDEINDFFKEKPLPTLKVLLSFIRNKPGDIAFKASSYATALHVNPMAAATTMGLSSLDYDAPIKKGHPSLRAIHLKTWTKIILELEKAEALAHPPGIELKDE